jgi:hypothetical protein
MENRIKIVEQRDGRVYFVLEDHWADDTSMVAVQYDHEIGSSECELNLGVAHSSSKVYSAICYGSVAEVSIFVYTSSDFGHGCAACNAPVPDTDVAKFYYELPCTEDCDQSAVGCSANVSLLDVEGHCSYDEIPIDIVWTEAEFVTFTVKNTWTIAQNSGQFVNRMSQIAVRYSPYPADVGQVTCRTSYNVRPAEEETYKARCDESGMAEVQVFVSDDAFDEYDQVDFPAECSQSSEGTKNCLYTFSLPCGTNHLCDDYNRRLSNEASDHCIDAGIKILQDDNTHAFPHNAIKIDCYDPDSSIQFRLAQMWALEKSNSWIAMLYSNKNGNHVCEKMNGIDFKTHSLHSSSCVDGVSVIDVYVHDPTFDSKTAVPIPTICNDWTGGDSKLAYYRIELSCSPRASCGDPNAEICASRSFEDLESSEAFTASESDREVNEPSVNDDDIPYCVSEDFPCEGEGNEMVYVCHYSARKGYQTFCIPEVDSDILRFYPNDYCGPCEGGYGGLWN